MTNFESFKLYRKEVREDKLIEDCLIVIQHDMSKFLELKFRKIFQDIDDFRRIKKLLVARINSYAVDSNKQKKLLYYHYPQKLINRYVALLKKYIKYRIEGIFCEGNTLKPLNYLFTQAIQVLASGSYWLGALCQAVPALSNNCHNLEKEIVIHKQKIVNEFYNKHIRLLQQVDSLPFHYARERSFLKLFYLNPEIDRLKDKRIFVEIYQGKKFIDYGLPYINSRNPDYRNIVNPAYFSMTYSDYDVTRRTISKRIEKAAYDKNVGQYDAHNLQKCLKYYKYLNIERKINNIIIKLFEETFQESPKLPTYSSRTFKMYREFIPEKVRKGTIKALRDSNQELEMMILTTSYLAWNLKPKYLRDFVSLACPPILEPVPKLVE